MLCDRTPEWWLARFLFATGIAQIVLLGLAIPPLFRACFGCDRVEFLGLPIELLAAIVGVAMASAGLVWMVRILRGPTDEPPAWRYRDR